MDGYATMREKLIKCEKERDAALERSRVAVRREERNMKLAEDATEKLDAALGRVKELEAAIRTVFEEIDMRHIEKHDEDTAHELRKLKWVLSKEGGA